LNLQRERWRDEFNHLQIVFILPKYAMRFFMLRGNDFFDFRSGLFQFAMDKDLLEVAQKQIHTDDVEKYKNFIPRQRTAKLLEIKKLLKEKRITNRADLFFEQGLLFDADSKYEQALASYDKALEIKPDYHQAWTNRGNVLKKLGKHDEAEKSSKQALKFSSKTFEYWNSEGIALISLGNYSEALKSLNKALELRPNDCNTLYNKANALKKLHRSKEEMDCYNKINEINPNFIRQKNKIALRYFFKKFGLYILIAVLTLGGLLLIWYFL